MTVPLPGLTVASAGLSLVVRAVGPAVLDLESAAAWRVGSIWQSKAQLFQQRDTHAAREHGLY